MNWASQAEFFFKSEIVAGRLRRSAPVVSRALRRKPLDRWPSRSEAQFQSGHQAVENDAVAEVITVGGEVGILHPLDQPIGGKHVAPGAEIVARHQPDALVGVCQPMPVSRSRTGTTRVSLSPVEAC